MKMNSEIDIRYFLNQHCCIENFRTPFVMRDRVIIANGVSILSMPMSDCPAKYKGIAKELPAVIFDAAHDDYDFKPFPDVKIPDPKLCSVCGGVKKGILVECPECLGMGIVGINTEFNTYTMACKTCDGEEEVFKPDGKEDCPHCWGIGRAFNSPHPVFVYGQKMDAALLYPLKRLSGVEVYPFVNEPMLIFKHKDVRGLIMGMKK